MPSLPDAHGIFVLLLTPFALYLFTRDRLPLEASGLAILIILMLSFQIFPYTVDGQRLIPTSFLAGFGNEALITICALMIMGRGLEGTGALQPLALTLAKAWTARPMLANIMTLLDFAYETEANTAIQTPITEPHSLRLAALGAAGLRILRRRRPGS